MSEQTVKEYFGRNPSESAKIDNAVKKAKEITITSKADKAKQVREGLKNLSADKFKVKTFDNSVSISTKSYETAFTEKQKKEINMLGHKLGYTGAKGTSLLDKKTDNSNQIQLYFS